MTPLEMITKRQQAMTSKYSRLFGLKLEHCEETWVLVAVNDLAVPYFCKLRGNRPQKTQYVLSGVRREWLNNKLNGV